MRRKSKSLSSFIFLEKFFPSMVGKLVYVPRFEYPVELVTGLPKWTFKDGFFDFKWNEMSYDANNEKDFFVPRGTPMILLDYKIDNKNIIFYQVLVKKEICWVQAQYVTSQNPNPRDLRK